MRSLGFKRLLICAAASLMVLSAQAGAATPGVGSVPLDDYAFNDTDSDGLDDSPQYLSDELKDFSSSECDQWTQDSYQWFKIVQAADNNGDCGMYREWWWDPAPGDTFEATAKIRAQNFSNPFRGRLVIHFWRGWETELTRECSIPIDASSMSGSTFVTVTKKCVVPSDKETDVVKVGIRANNGCSGCSDNGAGYGTMAVTRFKLEVLPKTTCPC